MAVAAADFYSYARATGTPLPKTKQEEAIIRTKKRASTNTR